MSKHLISYDNIRLKTRVIAHTTLLRSQTAIRFIFSDPIVILPQSSSIDLLIYGYGRHESRFDKLL